VGRNKRIFSTRFRKEINSVKKNGNTSKYTHHILETFYAHEIVENTTSIIHTTKARNNTIEKFHSCNFSGKKSINDNYSIIKNPTFRRNNDTELNKTDSELTYIKFTF